MDKTVAASWGVRSPASTSRIAAARWLAKALTPWPSELAVGGFFIRYFRFDAELAFVTVSGVLMRHLPAVRHVQFPRTYRRERRAPAIRPDRRELVMALR